MTTIAGSRATATLDGTSLTFTRKKGETVLPLEAIESIEHIPPRGPKAGLMRAVLVASWAEPRHPMDDPNTIQYVAGNVSEWNEFVADVEAAVRDAVPKRSLPLFSHHAGSGWPDGVQERPTEAERVAKIAHARRGAGEFAGVRFGGLSISYKGESQPLSGVRATVESAGELSSRMSGLNTVGGAMFFGSTGAIVGAMPRKRVDLRELYLSVEGDTFAWTVSLPAKKGKAAREFAARVNTASKR